MSITRMEGQEFRVTVPAKPALGHNLPAEAQQLGLQLPQPPLSQWATIHNQWDRTFSYSHLEATTSTRLPVQQVLLVTGTVTAVETIMVTAMVAVTIMVTATKANSGEKLRFSPTCVVRISGQHISQLRWPSRPCATTSAVWNSSDDQYPIWYAGVQIFWYWE